jgi:hypothetical protein
MVIHGAPKDIVMTMSTTVATTQDWRVSTDDGNGKDGDCSMKCRGAGAPGRAELTDIAARVVGCPEKSKKLLPYYCIRRMRRTCP